MRNPPIFLRLAGGLGNQLFQVAAASLYSKWLHKEVYVFSDMLTSYNLSREPLYQHILRPRCASWHHFSRSSFTSLSSLVSCRLRFGRLPVSALAINDRNILKSSLGTPKCFPVFMDGYFQNFWTYDLFTEALSNFLVPPIPESLSQPLVTSYVAVHIRGSDFLAIRGYSIASISFYLYCFEQAISHGYNSFVVYTDDPDYAHSILSVIRLRYPSVSINLIDSVSVLGDFNGLRSAPARIVGNSTFGWWAAALSSGGPTWSTSHFVAQCRKPFVLPGEIYVSGPVLY